jgi:hypothetical protein
MSADNKYLFVLMIAKFMLVVPLSAQLVVTSLDTFGMYHNVLDDNDSLVQSYEILGVDTLGINRIYSSSDAIDGKFYLTASRNYDEAYLMELDLSSNSLKAIKKGIGGYYMPHLNRGSIVYGLSPGGTYGAGQLFSYDPQSDQFAVEFEFWDDSLNTGSTPKPVLAEQDGNFLMASNSGSEFGYGAIFSFDTQSETHTIHYEFNVLDSLVGFNVIGAEFVGDSIIISTSQGYQGVQYGTTSIINLSTGVADSLYRNEYNQHGVPVSHLLKEGDKLFQIRTFSQGTWLCSLNLQNGLVDTLHKVTYNQYFGCRLKSNGSEIYWSVDQSNSVDLYSYNIEQNTLKSDLQVPLWYDSYSATSITGGFDQSKFYLFGYSEDVEGSFYSQIQDDLELAVPTSLQNLLPANLPSLTFWTSSEAVSGSIQAISSRDGIPVGEGLILVCNAMNYSSTELLDFPRAIDGLTVFSPKGIVGDHQANFYFKALNDSSGIIRDLLFKLNSSNSEFEVLARGTSSAAGFMSKPLIENNKIFWCDRTSGYRYNLNNSTNQILFTLTGGASILKGPYLIEDELFFATQNGLYSYDLSNNLITERVSIQDSLGNGIAEVVLDSSSKKIYVITRGGGQTGHGSLWSYEPSNMGVDVLMTFDQLNGVPSESHSSRLLFDDKLYIPTGLGLLIYDVSSGDRKVVDYLRGSHVIGLTREPEFPTEVIEGLEFKQRCEYSSMILNQNLILRQRKQTGLYHIYDINGRMVQRGFLRANQERLKLIQRLKGLNFVHVKYADDSHCFIRTISAN